MPAEWEPHRATWLGWPHERTDWPGKVATIPWVMAEIARKLARRERVAILVRDAAHARRARSVLRRAHVDLTAIDLHRISTDRGWLRDSGPIFVRDSQRGGAVAAVDFGSIGWAKYPNWRRDDRVPKAVARARGVPVVAPVVDGRRIVLEGGAIDVDGRGALLTTEECLLSDVQQRNPGLGRDGYERVLRDFLGARRVVWLGRGIAGDDTHGHVDDIARFVAPGVVAAAIERDRGDENFEPLRDNVRRLRRAGMRVVELPMPEPLFFAGRRMPASYANFYVGNGVVLAPTFDDPSDRIALSILARCFPRRQVVGIHAVDLVWGLGTIHCLTQQEPA
ncbi:MAG: agmatine deiminase family protein [Myxococcota bacterium]